MAIFACVVEQGSLAAAARVLGMSPSAVSQHLRALEASVGVPLLHRSTRKLTLTDAGAAYFPGCAAMVREAQGAIQRLAEQRDTLVGELRITATVGAAGAISEALSPLLLQHPQLQLRVLASDNLLDMIEQRIDISLRFNRQLADSTLIAHPLTQWPMILCATPRYLSRHGVPETPQALLTHRWISGIPNGPLNSRQFTLHHPHLAPVTLRIADGQVVSDSMSVVRAFTLAGMGISLQPLYEVRESLARGELIQLIPEWQPEPLNLTALTLERVLPEKTRQAIVALRHYFQQSVSG
ncbi:LysR family transcriptional regulator [Enterobacterales bacterium CwR94]|nr:LysR family transcriptional regulator [Enterobacterales bacterium CwR94]